MKRLAIAPACWLGLASTSATAQDPPPVLPRPAVVVRLDSPDAMGRAVLALFEGSKAPHPAAALAAWKRASREPDRLGKASEALIAALNPRMVDELRIVHHAEARLWPAGGRVRWAATIPHDDGSFGALATAFVLTDGAAEAPFRGAEVDRLGPLGAPLMARGAPGLVVAGDREGLAVAWERPPLDLEKAGRPGIAIEAGPGLMDALAGSTSIALRRLADLLKAGTISDPKAKLEVEGTTARASLRVEVDPALRPLLFRSRVDPTWLDWVPKDRAMAAFAVGVGVGADAEGWASAFSLLDRLERVDPARAEVAPSRLRLALLARTVGVRVEDDILPHLQGVSGWVGSDGRAIDAAVVLAHFDSEGVAERVVARVKREGDGRVALAGGKPVRLTRIGASAVFDWGDGSLASSIAAKERPELSAGGRLRDPRAGDDPPLGVGAIWPARVPGLIPDGSPLAKAVADAPPVTLRGRMARSSYALTAEWPGLDATVRRFLERIPLDPPPDRGIEAN